MSFHDTPTIFEALRKNRGTQLSIWCRWFKQEGWIVLCSLVSLFVIFITLINN